MVEFQGQHAKSPAPGSTALRHCAVLIGLVFFEIFLLLSVVVAISLLIVVVGLPLLVWCLQTLRAATRHQLDLASTYSHVAVAVRPTELPAKRPGLGGDVQFVLAAIRQHRTRLDLLWLVTNPIVGFAIAVLPLAAILNGIFGLVLVIFWRPLIDLWSGTWYLFIPVTSTSTAVLAGLLGLLQIIGGIAISGRCLRVHGRWVRHQLSSDTQAELRQRVKTLSQSRADVVDFQARELRRIERDLHDGAQARLVAMGMTLTAASHLVESDPNRARRMVIEARDSSSAALSELRNLVRGIHPPVLADRGLVEAVRSLALESQLPIDVREAVTVRPSLPVESALFFAISELLTNVAKHADAHCVIIEIRDDGDLVTVVVSDDGRGGATISPGSGLAGIERRIAAFDGALTVGSTERWSTQVTLTVPLSVSTSDR